MDGDSDLREVISVKGLWAGYDHETVLQDVSLTVYELDFIGLIGPNGGGKTTLLRVLLGLLQPMRGEVRIMGTSVREGRTHLGYVPQVAEFDREFPISVWDVARMGRVGHRGLLKRYTAEDDAIVTDALRRVGLLDREGKLAPVVRVQREGQHRDVPRRVWQDDLHAEALRQAVVVPDEALGNPLALARFGVVAEVERREADVVDCQAGLVDRVVADRLKAHQDRPARVGGEVDLLMQPALRCRYPSLTRPVRRR